ncbi:unnamed protein product [Cylindrotheca closterium]|uniref:Uncharacterized protein n=1 Tax=Cylindrotheca closterium TaxID=2856 RepID=A0AAD2D150_9STRA|nr:unnamed protein product [Cylindrotheca closterium]
MIRRHDASSKTVLCFQRLCLQQCETAFRAPGSNTVFSVTSPKPANVLLWATTSRNAKPTGGALESLFIRFLAGVTDLCWSMKRE